MGRKNNAKTLGRAIIRDRFGKKTGTNRDSSHLHSMDLDDGYDSSPLNLQSITEESSFQEFFTTAELAETKFSAEKLNIQFLNLNNQIDILSREKHAAIVELQEKSKNLLTIPRRPSWNKLMNSRDLERKEKEYFLEWRKNMVLLDRIDGLILTPYEKNLEFWRQLWRVIERSDIVVQIVDARNPLLFRCEDLERFVEELDQNKTNMILINKADFLTNNQRKIWLEYFSKINIQVAFFSAVSSSEKKRMINYECNIESFNKSTNQDLNNELANDMSNLEVSQSERNIKDNSSSRRKVNYTSNLLTREELISLFEKIHMTHSDRKELITVGFVGYPNVGKSSTINALLMSKKVSVSKTPGKTKHFQTIYLDNHLLLCDCPGLVMPSFVTTREEMVLNGILPVNQIKDHVPSITLLGKLIPRFVIENLYGFMIPFSNEIENPDRPPAAEEILNAHALNRGFMTQNGQPDNARSARYILKDFIDGKLLYCAAPPGYNQNEFHLFLQNKKMKLSKSSPLKAHKDTKSLKTTNQVLDTTFFDNRISNIHVKGNGNYITRENRDSPSVSEVQISIYNKEKLWKKKKNYKKISNGKSRKMYGYLDKY